jgi:hypothetical protein
LEGGSEAEVIFLPVLVVILARKFTEAVLLQNIPTLEMSCGPELWRRLVQQ